MVFLICPESFSTLPWRYFSKWRLKIFRGGNHPPLPSNFDGSPYPHLRGVPPTFFIKMTANDVKEMPGFTFFCVFVRPETNHQEGGNHPPPGRTRVNPRLTKLLFVIRLTKGGCYNPLPRFSEPNHL